MTSDLAITCASLHAVAEHILAAARYRAVGRIGLQVTSGGFGTPPFGDDARTVGVEGLDIVVRDAGGEQRAPMTTLRAAGELVGIEPGAPADVYTPTTPCKLDAPLEVNQAACDRLVAWFALGDEALRRFAEEIAADDPSAITLWPEHFDIGLSAAGINYGVSPGDSAIAEPYLYVGPHDPPPVGGFWNQAFGAASTAAEIPSAQDALSFFRRGRDEARRQT